MCTFPTLAPGKNDESEPYSIVPNFFSQQATRNKFLPTSNGRPHVAEACRVTNKSRMRNITCYADIGKSWFADNEMDQYVELDGRTGQDVGDPPSNLLRLRRYVHFLCHSLVGVLNTCVHASQETSFLSQLGSCKKQSVLTTYGAPVRWKRGCQVLSPQEYRRFTEGQGRGRSASATKCSRHEAPNDLLNNAEVTCVSKRTA